jgi:peroxiredoxin
MKLQKILKAGTVAPHFTLPSAPGERLSLRSYRGKPVILAFYPADWSPVCGGQLSVYNELLPEFRKYGAQLIGISVDGPWSHSAFAKQKNIKFPLLSDFEPKGATAKSYGVYRTKEGITERALFVIGRDGRIAWSYKSPIATDPGADGILKALEGLKK